jgi:hypothetical protein
MWFGSLTRYLQHRINIVHDALAAKAAVPTSPQQFQV